MKKINFILVTLIAVFSINLSTKEKNGFTHRCIDGKFE